MPLLSSLYYLLLGRNATNPIPAMPRVAGPGTTLTIPSTCPFTALNDSSHSVIESTASFPNMAPIATTIHMRMNTVFSFFFISLSLVAFADLHFCNSCLVWLSSFSWHCSHTVGVFCSGMVFLLRVVSDMYDLGSDIWVLSSKKA